MPKYIVLLRGINVSGQKKIKMAELREHLAELEYSNVETYIQSGNIILKTDIHEKNEIQKSINYLITDKYGFNVEVFVKTPADLQHVLDNNPFINERNLDIERIYYTFLEKEPDITNVQKLAEYSFPPEEYILDGVNLYFYSPDGYGRAKMNNNFFENKLKVFATTRNWKTVKKLYDMTL